MLTKTEGLILRVTRFKESDRFIHVLAPSGEVLELLARSVGRSQKRFAGGLEPLSWQRFEVSKRRATMVAEQAQHVDDFLEIRHDLPRFYMACYAAERALAAAPCEGLFSLMTELLSTLKTPTENLAALRACFELRLLDLSGFGPRLAGCAHCGTQLGDLPAALDADGAGFVCGAHARPGAAAYPAGVRALLRALGGSEFSHVARVRMSEAQRAAVRACLRHFMASHFPGPVRSEKLLAGVM